MERDRKFGKAKGQNDPIQDQILKICIKFKKSIHFKYTLHQIRQKLIHEIFNSANAISTISGDYSYQNQGL